MATSLSARTSLRAFLSHARTNLKNAIERKDQITLVIGNESADLDSITCSIVYAYLKSSQSKARLHVPLLNIPKADIGLRPELLALLPHANIESQHLITLDDLPSSGDLKEALPPQNTRWILVDHNALPGELGDLYADRVVGVIDHHVDEGKVPKDTGSEPRIITKSGSCSSLVVESCREEWDALSGAGSSSGAAHGQGDSLVEDRALTTLWDAQVAHLALAAILIDTHNLKSKDKVTEHDVNAVIVLESKINSCAKLSTDYDRDSLFQQVNDAKSDLESLPLDGILRKDYKQWTEQGMAVGISSSVKSLDYLQRKAEQGSQESSYGALVKAARTFAKERSLAIYAIMTAFQSEDGNFSRELLILGQDKNGSAASKKFEELSGSQLKLDHVDGEDDDDQWLRIWKQGEVKSSRKQVGPLIREAMRGKASSL